MLGAGLHLRKGFSPLISHNLWKVYAVPKILYGLEVMPIKKKEMEQMEIMQMKLLRDRPFNVKGGGVMVFCFVQNFFFGQHKS